MANATSQILLGLSGFPMPPGTPHMAYDFGAPGKILNGSGVQVTTFGEKIATISDLTSNAIQFTQATDANRGIYLPVDNDPYLYCPTQPNANDFPYIIGAYLNTSGEFTVDCRIAPNDWTPSSVRIIAVKGTEAAFGTSRSWKFQLETTGALSIIFYNYNGGAPITQTATSTANLSALADNSVSWVRVNYVPDTGSGQYRVRFFTSSDGLSWTQLGTDVTAASHNIVALDDIGLLINRSTASAQGTFTNKFVGRFYAFRYYIAGVLTAEWYASDSKHLYNWGPLRTGQNPISYGSYQFLIKEPSAWLDGTDFYSCTPAVATGTTWKMGMKSKTLPGSLMISFGAGAAQNFPYISYEDASTYNISSNDDTSGSSLTADANKNYSVNTVGNTIVSRAAGNITFKKNQYTLTPTVAAQAGTGISYLFGRNANRTSGVVTRLAFYKNAGPSDADLDTWLGAVPGRNNLDVSQAFDAAGLKGMTTSNIAVTQAAAIAPDGTLSADFVSMINGNTTHLVYNAGLAVNAKAYCVSYYIKKPTSNAYRYWGLKFSDGVSYNKFYIVDTDTMLLSFADVGVTGGILDVGNGWYRVWASWTYLGTHANANVGFDPTLISSGAVNINSNGNGIWMWGLMLNPGTTPEEYRYKPLRFSPNLYNI